MNIALSEALGVVLRDLGTCGAPVPDVRDRRWSDGLNAPAIRAPIR
jgi:hypothetical protein